MMSAGFYLCNGGGHGGGGGGPKFKGKALRAGRGARGRVAVVAGAGKAGPRLLMHHLLGSGYQNTPISRSHSLWCQAHSQGPCADGCVGTLGAVSLLFTSGFRHRGTRILIWRLSLMNPTTRGASIIDCMLHAWGISAALRRITARAPYNAVRRRPQLFVAPAAFGRAALG